MKNVQLVLGTMSFGETVFEPETVEIIKYFLSNGYTELDTAYVYNEGKSEEFIGNALKEIGREKLKISTKVNPRITGKLDGEAAYMQLNQSLERLGIENVDTFYLHFPDKNTPIEDVLNACNQLHKDGKFKELGLSNFPAWLVTDVFYKCKENGWIVPTVYEGIYNPLTRKAENELNDVLNNFNIRFYAYNPLAGGLLTNKYNSISDIPTDGRFVNRPNYKNRYWKKSFFDAINIIKKRCESNDTNIVEATYRWLMCHSMLNGDRQDAIIIGISKLSQLKQNIEAINKGKLNDELISAFEEAYEICRADSPEYFRFYNGGKN